ncbi:unnamed protein product [Rangifer tarandus platyrhynchus]|uniref:Uncharacterized protein n=1 Tax=Rangifer tarandus platyrhynchus TaxID=3082113 RepID=A0AC59Z261_RANTA
MDSTKIETLDEQLAEQKKLRELELHTEAKSSQLPHCWTVHFQNIVNPCKGKLWQKCISVVADISGLVPPAKGVRGFPRSPKPPGQGQGPGSSSRRGTRSSACAREPPSRVLAGAAGAAGAAALT